MAAAVLAVGAAVPLTGNWSTTISGAPSAQFDGVWKLHFASGGSYVISKAGQTLVTGKATFKGTVVTFHDLTAPRRASARRRSGRTRGRAPRARSA